MENFKAFWQKYETKIVLSIGFILIAGLAFEGGYIQGKTQKESPIVLEKATQCPQNESGSNSLSSSDKTAATKESSVSDKETASQTDCAFVGSKNSNKYHLPTCRFAKNIKPENLVCFKSAEDAAQKNYQPDKTCIK